MWRGMILFAVLLLVVAVVLIAVLASIHGGGIVVVVSSSHIADTVDVVLTVDGSVKETTSLPAWYQFTWQGTVTWFGGGTCTVDEVEASSTGGGFGPQVASSTATICQGSTAKVDLSA